MTHGHFNKVFSQVTKKIYVTSSQIIKIQVSQKIKS